MKHYDIVLVSVGVPVLLGVYKDCRLVFFIIIEGKTSDVLPFIFANLFLDSVESSKVKVIECGIYKDFNTKDCNFIESKNNAFIESGFVDSKNNAFFMESNFLDSKSNIFLKSNFLDSKTSDFIESNISNLGHFHNAKNIYYARGVGSLSSIKLTHIFLHTLVLTKDVRLHATNSFHFTHNNEIKAFGAMSFFLKDSIESNFVAKDSIESNVVLTDSIESKLKISKQNAIDSILKEHIYIAKSTQNTQSLKLPLILLKDAFFEPCSPLYITPPL